MRKLNEQSLKFKGCISFDCELTRRSRKGGLCVLWGGNVSLSLVSSCYIMSQARLKEKQELMNGFVQVYMSGLNRKNEIILGN